MIKLKIISRFDPAKGYVRDLQNRVSFKGKLKTKWFTLDTYERQWEWKATDEPVVGPKVLTAWSK